MNATLGLVELPEYGLLGEDGLNLLAHTSKRSVLISKQVLLSSLQGLGYDAQLVDLRAGDDCVTFGEVRWKGGCYQKAYLGRDFRHLSPDAHDLWGLTNNFTQNREITLLAIHHLASTGRPVVVGGSDAFAAPDVYLAAGAAAVVMDKSGGVNGPLLAHLLGEGSASELTGVALPGDGDRGRRRVVNAMSPEDWPLPSPEVVSQCLGRDDQGLRLPGEGWAMGSVFSDLGCDRKCDFCQTPEYKVGYKAMSPRRVLQWAARQKEAGARGIMMSSDQFLARLLKKGGRDEVLEIMSGLRDLDLGWLWNNGIELKKMTLDRGIQRRSGAAVNLDPDEELIHSLFHWDGTRGCWMVYIPAERPLTGRQNYSKLLPWQEHVRTLKAIAAAGVPNIRYGLIIGFEDDSHEGLSLLEEAVSGVAEELESSRPDLSFQVAPFSLYPIQGTPQEQRIQASGLLAFGDPGINGSIWTTSVNTRHLSYGEVSDWQSRLTRIGNRHFMPPGRIGG